LKDKILKELRVSDKINKMDKIIWKKIKENSVHSVYSVKISNLCLRFFFAIFPGRRAVPRAGCSCVWILSLKLCAYVPLSLCA